MKVSPQFKHAFDQVMTHYQMTEEEIEACKQAVRRDFENAQLCYLAMFDEIRPRISVTADKITAQGWM